MKWLRIKDIAEKLGVSISYVRKYMTTDPSFPKAIRLSPKVMVFNEDEVNEWMTKIQREHTNDST